MKLASIRDRVGETRIVASSRRTAEFLIDLSRAYALYLAEVEKERAASAIAQIRIPTDMRLFFEGGESGLSAARKAIDYADTLLLAKDDAQHWRDTGLIYHERSVEFLPPVPRPGKIISCGANYREHVQETSEFGANAAVNSLSRGPARPLNDTPPAFAKFSSTMIGHDQPIVRSRHTAQLDYEGELCVVIGKRCKDVSPESYLDVVAGYTIMNDVSMRDIQFARFDRKTGVGQFDNLMGKNLDTTAPCGPFIVTKDEILDPQRLQLSTYVNGDLRQNENTANMVFPISTIIAHYSRMTLEPGDVFTTGNPAGSAMGRKPPDTYWLKPGDVVEVEIEKVGRLRNPVIAGH